MIGLVEQKDFDALAVRVAAAEAENAVLRKRMRDLENRIQALELPHTKWQPVTSPPFTPYYQPTWVGPGTGDRIWCSQTTPNVSSVTFSSSLLDPQK